MAAVPPLAESPLPWHEPGRLTGHAHLDTLKLIALEPSTAFRQMSWSRSLGPPPLWLAVTGRLGSAVGQVSSLLFTGLAAPFVKRRERLANLGARVAAPMLGVLAAVFVGGPAAAIASQ